MCKGDKERPRERKGKQARGSARAMREREREYVGVWECVGVVMVW